MGIKLTFICRWHFGWWHPIHQSANSSFARWFQCYLGKHRSNDSLKQATLQGTNISHLGNRKIIFKMPCWGDMLVPWRVFVKVGICSCKLHHISSTPWTYKSMNQSSPPPTSQSLSNLFRFNTEIWKFIRSHENRYPTLGCFRLQLPNSTIPRTLNTWPESGESIQVTCNFPYKLGSWA